MDAKMMTLVRDLTRLKIVFTITSTEPLKIRVFTHRGLEKIRYKLDFRRYSADDNYEEISDSIGKKNITIFFQREVKVRKTKRSKRK